jgi:PhzF family phenazine biosynthesis protein
LSDALLRVKFAPRMSRRIRIFQVDAFTTDRFTGNPAGVVLDADALTDAEMLAIARELNNADTAFVLKPDGGDHELRVRFFTPRTEASFVGHATVATHFVLSRDGAAPLRNGNGNGRVRQKQKSGVVDVEVRGEGATRRIAVRQPAPPLGRQLNDRERLAVLDALALSTGDIDTRCPLRIVGGSGTRLLIGVRGTDQLKQLKPDFLRLTTLSAQLGAAGFFVFTLSHALPGCLTESRMFCPALGIPEDPVSGNAHGLLGAYLAEQGLLQHADGRAKFTGAQGHHLHRSGRIDVELEFAPNDANELKLDAVWIVGQAVSIFETEMTL